MYAGEGGAFKKKAIKPSTGVVMMMRCANVSCPLTGRKGGDETKRTSRQNLRLADFRPRPRPRADVIGCSANIRSANRKRRRHST